MLKLAESWEIDVERSKEWLFIRVLSTGFDTEPNPALSETLWSIAQQHSLDRFVIELEDSALMTSYLVGQILLLKKRANLNGGVVRVCGLSSANHDVIRLMQLADQLPNYTSREDAIMGHRPRKPR